jgi:hypothetical protein
LFIHRQLAKVLPLVRAAREQPDQQQDDEEAELDESFLAFVQPTSVQPTTTAVP